MATDMSHVEAHIQKTMSFELHSLQCSCLEALCPKCRELEKALRREQRLGRPYAEAVYKFRFMKSMRNRELNLSSSDSWERAISNLEGALRRREKLSKEKNTMGKIRKVKPTPICFEYIENYQETMSPQRFNKIQPFSTFDDKCNRS
ncbi:hypothetical protein ACOME3_003268 [Neoechinorhynchus agilis]